MSINDHICNYYEQPVAEQIRQLLPEETNVDFLADIACVALNRLPARYIHHAVDMAFYLPSGELIQMQQSIRQEVEYAIDFVRRHRRDEQSESLQNVKTPTGT